MVSELRVRILCEDRRSERMLVKLCERYHVRVAEVLISPRGQGNGSAWVLKKYSAEVKRHRSKNFQRNLCLLAAIDGDNQGLSARKIAMDAELTSNGLTSRSQGERISVFVPTWSIETWLLHLSGLGQPPPETTKLKDAWPAQYKAALTALERDEPGIIKDAVAAWPGRSIPSLADAAVEGRRVGLS